jgi:hypothetical protein
MPTDVKVRSARPTENPYARYDSDALFLFVSLFVSSSLVFIIKDNGPAVHPDRCSLFSLKKISDRLIFRENDETQ